MPATIAPETLAAIDAASITPSQKNAVRRVLERLAGHNNYQPMVFTVELNTQYASFVSVVIQGRRTDCEEYSPRMVSTAIRMHLLVGRKGGRKLADYADGLSTYDKKRLRVIASLYRCRISR